MVKSCSALFTFSDAFVLYDNFIAIDLYRLNPLWLNDIRPKIGDEIVTYIRIETTDIVLSNSIVLKLNDLNEQELITVYNYFERMIPLPSNKNVKGL